MLCVEGDYDGDLSRLHLPLSRSWTIIGCGWEMRRPVDSTIRFVFLLLPTLLGGQVAIKGQTTNT